MFSAWGAFIYRFRRPVTIIAILIAVASTTLASQVTGALSAGGWTDPDSQSAAVSDRLADEFGAGGGAIVALFRGTAGDDARSAAFQDRIATSLKRLVADDRVDGTVGWTQTHDDRFISTDGTSAYIVVRLAITDEAAVDEMPAFRALIDQPAGMTFQLAGVAPVTQDQAHQSEKELDPGRDRLVPVRRADPGAVFASLVAAGLPLVVAGLAIPTTLARRVPRAQVTELSIYVQNVATMLGLALAIDYSLFMVSRFREELRRGRTSPGGRGHRRDQRQGGHVLGARRRVGLSGLLLFQPSALRSFGIGGALVVAASVFYALTFLPAVLGMLGPRVNALSVAGVARSDPCRSRSAGRTSGDGARANRAGSAWPTPSWPDRSSC